MVNLRSACPYPIIASGVASGLPRGFVLSLAFLAVGCGVPGSPQPPAPPDLGVIAAGAGKTLDELAAFGNKHAGSDAGRQAGDYLMRRFMEAGLTDVRFESFSFPAFTVNASSLAVTVDGVPRPMMHDVFAYGGAGQVDADVIFVGKGHDGDYAGKDVKGKVALMLRDPMFHRQAQYRVMLAHDAVAMLYVSQSPDNLIQIGTVSEPEDGLGKVPAITVGQADGQALIDAAAAGKTLHATLAVDAAITPATGRNVIGRLPGNDPSGAYLLVGAHYDSWFKGSVDNGTGVAALLEILKLATARPDRRLGLVFVAYDGEELGLFGGYDYLRQHVVVAKEPMLAFANLEMPANHNDDTQGLARTNGGPIDAALVGENLNTLYGLYAGMELVPKLFGGIIPTDIQGMYWYGLQGFTTACNSPYYHTIKDTPDKVDTAYLADAASRFAETLSGLDRSDDRTFQVHDPKLWLPQVVPSQAGADLVVDVVARDAAGTAQAGAKVTLMLDVDDFTRASLQEAQADAKGHVAFTVPAAALHKGQGSRFIHVTTGVDFPLSEVILPLDSRP